MGIMDHKVREDMGQYLHSLDAFSRSKNPPVAKKEVSIDPLIH